MPGAVENTASPASSDTGRSIGEQRPLRVGILGCGHVGAALVALLQRDAAHLGGRTGLELEIARVAVRNLSAERSVELPPSVLTRDSESLVTADDVDIVVEAMGGIEPARHLTTAALGAGKPVVTANKELIANVGEELFALAEDHGVDLAFEAAVAGGIPLIGVLRHSLIGERITRVMGIVNGTTNFILTRMTEHGADYAEVLGEAQRLGYAEADPTADVEGSDAGAKAAILAMTAFGAKVVAGDVHQEGISRIGRRDIVAAARMGHVIKLLAVAERQNGEIAVRVHPAMVPLDHPLASVRDAFNAVFLEGEAVGDVMLYGRGAGGFPTAGAMLGDLIRVAQNLRRGVCDSFGPLCAARLRPIDETFTAYHLQFDVADAPGVLAAVSGAFGQHGVSIRSVEQTTRGGATDDVAHLEFITHRAREADVAATLRDVRELSVVRRVGNAIRVIGE
ncbi:homoserine dehydrogenase [Candidatus Poriferisodalis sp.]|uniref:homoserine dehydrogenase n=1 Tax=Candidatus Poriferisodalis sp. TaxID=3101277 RepID=UPI003B010CEB